MVHEYISVGVNNVPILTVCHRNRISWEIIIGGAEYILKGRIALGNNDHPIKTIQYIYIYINKRDS